MLLPILKCSGFVVTLKSVAASVALDPAAPVDVDGADNKADNTGVVDVAVVMIDDVAIVDRTDTGAAVDDGSVDAVVINWRVTSVIYTDAFFEIKGTCYILPMPF